MKPKTMLKLDWWAYPLYSLVLLWQRLFYSKAATAPVGETIVIKMMGIGSITRIVETLRQNRADLSRVHFLTFQANRELCELLEIPNVYYLSDESLSAFAKSCYDNIKKLRQLKASQIIDFERTSNLLGVFRLMLTAATSTGTVSFYDIPIDQDKGLHKRFSLRGRSINDLICLSLNYITQLDALPAQVAKTFTNREEILVNINASDYLPQRKYPPRYFAKVIEGLLKEYPMTDIHLMGSGNERAYVQDFIDAYFRGVNNIVNCCGQWNLHELAERLASTRLLITNDSGPMHLAVKMKTKTVAIWGPTSPAIFGYMNNPAVINLESAVDGPRFIHPKSLRSLSQSGHIHWMEDIEPKQVVDAALSLLTKQPATV